MKKVSLDTGSLKLICMVIITLQSISASFFLTYINHLTLSWIAASCLSLWLPRTSAYDAASLICSHVFFFSVQQKQNLWLFTFAVVFWHGLLPWDIFILIDYLKLLIFNVRIYKIDVVSRFRSKVNVAQINVFENLQQSIANPNKVRVYQINV